MPGNDGKWWLWTNPARLPLTFDGEETYACPRQTLLKDGRSWHRIFIYYGAYKAGHLPQVGATMDQSNKAMEVFNILDAVNGEADAELSKPKTVPPALAAAAQGQRGPPRR